MAFVEGIEAHEIEAALAEIRAGASNQFDPEAMFASHLLLMRWGEEDSRRGLCEPAEDRNDGAGVWLDERVGGGGFNDPRKAADWFIGAG